MRLPAAIPVLAAILAVPVLLLAPRAARADGECNVEAGPDDRVAKGETLVIRSGERVEDAIALDGDLVVEDGAVVEKAVALGGKLTVRTGGEVRKDAVAIGGDVVVESRARVGKDAVSLGGQVRAEKGSRIGGSVVGLAVQAGNSSLARALTREFSSTLEACRIARKDATGG